MKVRETIHKADERAGSEIPGINGIAVRLKLS